jgi:hypothetical protein
MNSMQVSLGGHNAVNADHLCPQIGQKHPGERRGPKPGKLDHFKALQRSRHVSSFFRRLLLLFSDQFLSFPSPLVED